jgi:hypothetical protein
MYLVGQKFSFQLTRFCLVGLETIPSQGPEGFLLALRMYKGSRPRGIPLELGYPWRYLDIC